MRARIAVFCVVVIFASLSYEAVARAGEPIFVKWLVADDPGDETISDYWERAQRDELSAPALVDLGTMLFYRGFNKDALQMYQRALDMDKDLFEAWFRIGLVEHSQGNLTNAEQAYERCLKKRPAHGWCNFYLGLLEEQFGHSVQAMQHYEQAFKSDPSLANPKVNPEVLSSQLAIGAQLKNQDLRSFETSLPMRYLQPNMVRKVYEQFESIPVPSPPSDVAEEAPVVKTTATPVAVSTPVPATVSTPVPVAPPPRPAAPERRVVPQRAPASPTPKASGGASNMPQITNTSGEVLLIPRWQGAWELAEALV